nr:immunoglobulin heavy chain junction region [Mus musculus]
ITVKLVTTEGLL